jgi:hypothetical protein
MNLHTGLSSAAQRSTNVTAQAPRPDSPLRSAIMQAENIGGIAHAVESKLHQLLDRLRGPVPSAVEGASKDPGAPPSIRRLEMALNGQGETVNRISGLVDELDGLLG